MAIKIGTISVELTANTASLVASLTKAQQVTLTSSRNIERSLKLVTGAAAAMGTALAGAFTAMATQAEEYAHSIHLAAMATGTSTEMFSKLAYNAKLAGVPIDNVKMALERMARTASAAQGGNKQSVQAYAALGISVKDLRGPLKDSGDLLVAVSKKMNTFKDSTQKTGIEQKLLGRSGAELAPMMHQLATGFDKASKQATLFGVVVGDRTAEQALQLHQALAQLESISLGLSLRLLDGVAPALSKVGDKLVSIATSSTGLQTITSIANSAATSIAVMGDAFEFLANHTTAVKRVLEGLVALQVASTFVAWRTSALGASVGIETIGLAATKMISRMAGINALIPLLTSVTAAISTEIWMIGALASEEGVATAATYGLSTAFNSLKAAMLSNPYTVVAAALALIGYRLYEVAQAAKETEPDGGRWADVWNGAIASLEEHFDGLGDKIRQVMGLSMTASQKAAAAMYSSGGFHSGQSLINEAGRKRRDANGGIIDYGNGVPQRHNNPPQLDAPQLPQTAKPEKIDILGKKLQELAASAKAAHQMLLDVGKGPDFERADAVEKEYNKTVIELTESLKTQHKTLSDADKAAIHASIATQINDDSQRQYAQELKNSTDELKSQTYVQNILNAAISKGAEAVRVAAITAYIARRDASKSPEWLALSQAERATNAEEYGKGLDAKNAGEYATALLGLDRQIDAQKLLNAAIFAGKDAREQAQHAVEQQAIINKYGGVYDTNNKALNDELDANQKLFDMKQEAADEEKAASMDALRTYQDQADALQRVASVAALAGHAIDSMQLKAADKANWDAYLKSVDDAKLAVGDAGDGVRVFFDQMARESKTAAESMKDALSSVFDSLNHDMVNLMTGQKANFAEMFRGFSTQMAQFALKKGEQGIANGVMNKLGKGDPTKDGVRAAVEKSNAYLATIAANTAHGLNTGASGASDVASTLSGASTGSDVSGGIGIAAALASVIPGFGWMGAFAGHRATGGNVTAGMSYDVGELGREKFTPSQDGKITPHNQISNGAFSIGHIDARGANDPAQTEMAIHRAMTVYAPAIAAGAMGAAKERNLRSPSSRRG